MSNPQFRNLVFEGGGVKGIAYGGAIEALQQQGILSSILRIGGTSAGAIASSLLACGADVQALRGMLEATPFDRFADRGFGYVRATHRLLNDYGWYKGDRFIEWMQGNLEIACGEPNITFSELFAKHQQQPDRYRRLFIIGTNLSKQRSEVFSHLTTPDMPIWLAVRISMSIPLYFQSVKYRGDVYVDGGVTWNFPINLFDQARFMTCDPCLDEAVAYNRETLGIRVAGRLPELGEPPLHPEPRAINNLKDYTTTLVNYLWETVNRQHLREHDWHRMVFIDTSEISPVDFALAKADIALLLQRGETGVNRYMDWFNDPTQEPKNRVV